MSDPSGPFGPDDLATSLLNRSEAGRGRFDHRTWTVEVGGDGSRDAARLISVHESLHADLNDSTAYGLLLHVAAGLAESDAPGWPTRLAGLVADCRTTHECFATWISLLVVADGRTALLAEYPRYARYHRLGDELAAGFRGAYLRYHAVAAALRLCMQSGAPARALDVGLGSFRPADLTAADRPDLRLRALRGLIDTTVWAEAWANARTTGAHLPGWSAIEATETEGGRGTVVLDAAFDSTSAHLMHAFYEALRTRLEAHGMPSLPFDGHTAFAQALVDAADRIAPPARRGRLRAATGDEDAATLLIGNFEQERWVIGAATAARWTPLDQVPSARWPTLSSAQGTDQHLFLVSRLGHRIAPQHRFEPPATLPSEPVLAIRRSLVVDGSRIVEYFPIDTPAALDAVLDAVPLPAHANLSMATLGDEAWAARWLPTLAARTTWTVLVDLSLLLHLRRWLADRRFVIRYATLDVPLDDRVQTVFVCRPETPTSPVFVAPCSAVTSAAWTHAMTEQLEHRDLCVADEGWAQTQAATLGIALGHLLREERVFDLLAATTHRAPTHA